MDHSLAAVRENMDNLTENEAVNFYTIIGAALVLFPAADSNIIESVIVDEISHWETKGNRRDS
jgi:hypothetical protein